ncbi:DUF3618 domain-containing protein [Kitasatospora indigofera]|uniref:Membrane protein n=1 Tax=Kitasatospora indigofera TaxID=67307 RepID=A0A919FR65_9ACTN|nr:DUF3618 domain-containing protein [Kitasatospora herbaricolor]GHH70488.1 membrane protein [Kitasatospora indigofera]
MNGVALVGEASTKDKADTRTAAQIEADIARTRTKLASTLDELAVRVHPSTVAAQVKAKAVASVEQKAGRAYVAASGAVEKAKAQFTDEKGRPRKERIVPAALVGVGVVLLLASARKRRRG